MIRAGRRGFTLLELIVALGIGVLLLIALYLAFSTLAGQQRAGRALAERSAAVRSLLARMERDILSELTPLDPLVNATAVQLSSGTTSTSSTSGTGATGGVVGAGPNPTGPVVFNLGLQGDATHLTLFISRSPSEVFRVPPGQDPPLLSDLRRVTYWLAGDTNAPKGLAWQELKVATTQDALTPFDPGQVDEGALVIDDTVVNLTFEYFDGTEWQDSWDGTALQTDGQTPMGPPAAVAINLTVRRPGATSNADTAQYRHVVAIPTANNLVTTPTPPTSTTSGSTGQ